MSAASQHQSFRSSVRVLLLTHSQHPRLNHPPCSATRRFSPAGKALELFASELLAKASALAAKEDAAKSTLQASHMCAAPKSRTRAISNAADACRGPLDRSKSCVDSESLFDFLRGTVNEVPAAPPKRACASSSSSAPKRKAVAGGAEAAPSATTGAELPVPFAGDYRPLADEDDDYDA